MRYLNVSDYIDELNKSGQGRLYTNHKTCPAVNGCGLDKKRRLLLVKSGDKYSCYCFHCNLADQKLVWYKNHIGTNNTFEDKKQSNIEIYDYKPLIFKDNSSLEINNNYFYYWLIGKGLSFEEIRDYNIGYSKSKERIIFPLEKSDNNFKSIKYYVARSILKNVKPKVLSNIPEDLIIFPNSNFSKSLIIVEDIISAIKVGRVLSCMPLFGTHLSKYRLNKLVESNYNKIIVWLDPDVPGRKGAQKLRKQLENFKEIKVIMTDNDPKYYDTSNIYEILNA